MKYPGADPTKPPSEDFEWRGQLPIGGDKGAWYNPITDTSLHPDLNHAEPKGEHWDYTGPDQVTWSLFPGGRIELNK